MRVRKHIRLKGYDYSVPNYYFVTICTKKREELFVPFVDLKYGHELPQKVIGIFKNVAAASYAAKNTKILKQCFDDLEHKYYENLEVDFYCIMPEHIHVIVTFHDKVYKRGAIGSRSYSLGDIIRALKAMVTRDIGKPVWQPNFYEHIIRSEQSLDRIRRYILNNPWVEYQDIHWKKLDPNV